MEPKIKKWKVVWRTPKSTVTRSNIFHIECPKALVDSIQMCGKVKVIDCVLMTEQKKTSTTGELNETY